MPQAAKRAVPMSDGVLATATPAASIAAIFASAPSIVKIVSMFAFLVFSFLARFQSFRVTESAGLLADFT